MKLSVHMTHPRLGKRLPRDIVSTAWGFDGLTVPQALRRVADALEVPEVVDDKGVVTTPARGRTDNVVVWISRTDDARGSA